MTITVAELMEFLKNQPPDAKVMIETYDDNGRDGGWVPDPVNSLRFDVYSRQAHIAERHIPLDPDNQIYKHVPATMETISEPRVYISSKEV